MAELSLHLCGVAKSHSRSSGDEYLTCEDCIWHLGFPLSISTRSLEPDPRWLTTKHTFFMFLAEESPLSKGEQLY